MPHVKVVQSHRTRYLVIAVLAVILGVGGYLGYVAYLQQQHAKQAADHATMLARAKAFYQHGQYQEAADALNAYLQTNPPERYQYDATVTLGATYRNLNDDQKALATYLKAEQLFPRDAVSDHAGVLGAIAYYYDKAGNKAQAITYYQRTIAATKLERPGRATEAIAGWQKRINQLEQP